jgi:cellulose synthase/poly-beta-1,6-N-acetylglucosamine synthase-like glycosyltransferase
MKTITIIYFIMFFFGIYFLLLFLLLHKRNRKTLYDYPESKQTRFISFLVPAYNEEKSIKTTIKALLAVKYPKNKKEIIIINDGSTDKTQEIVKKFEKRYKSCLF